MEKNPNTQIDLLDLTEDQKKQLIESLILEGTCEYSFKIFDRIPVILRAITFQEQEDLSKAIGDIPEEVFAGVKSTGKQEAETVTRKLTIQEFNLRVTALTLEAYVKSFNGKPLNTSKLATPIVQQLSEKLRAFRNTVDTVLSSIEEIKN